MLSAGHVFKLEMYFSETILCATAPASSSAGAGTISLHDIENGSSLASFKQTSAAPHCTAFYESKNGEGGFMLAAQPDKSILNVYNFQKVVILLKAAKMTNLNRPGSNGRENSVARKINLHSSGPQR